MIITCDHCQKKFTPPKTAATITRCAHCGGKTRRPQSQELLRLLGKKGWFMRFGWMILTILAIIGALAYFGIIKK